jgi:GT2 family glycosyltransferase
MRDVVIGVPLGPDYQADARTVAMVESWFEFGKIHTIYEATPSPEEGRDKIVKIAQQILPKPTHILFIDSDVLPRPKTLERLMSHDKDIISGVVPICQQGGFKWNASREKGWNPIKVDPNAKNWGLPDNPFKAETIGFGVVLVKMDVFEKIEWPYWRSQYKPGLRTLGEDVYFCEKAKKAGFDIWVDPMVKCNHVTRANYLSIIRNLKQGAI